MSSALTTAMLALPNDPLGRGVVSCWPLEDVAGSSSAVDVATASNAASTLSWQGVWSSTNSYNPRDVIVINSIGTLQVGWYCVAPIPSGGSVPGTDINNWVKLSSTSYTYQGTAATPITATVNTAYIDPTDHRSYRCTTAVTSSNIYPNADTTHWAAIAPNLLAGGKTLSVSGTGSTLTAGGNAVVPGAASSWGCSTSNPTTAIFSHSTPVGDMCYGMGSAVSFFVIVNVTTAAFSVPQGALFEIGSSMRLRWLASGGLSLSNGAGYGGGASAAGNLSSEEALTLGVHSVEASFDGKSLSLILDGNLVAYQYMGANGFNGSLASLTTSGYPALLQDGSFTGAICQMNNALLLNRNLTRSEHRSLMVAAGLTPVTTNALPARNRSQDPYNTATAAASLGTGCANCGGSMTVNEASVTNGSLRYHPNCQIKTLLITINTASTVQQASQWAQQQMLSYSEILGEGISQYFSTRFVGGTDMWGTASSSNYFWRGSITGGGGVALAAHAAKFQSNHWMWSIVRGQMEQTLNWTIGASQGQFGLAPNYSTTLSDGGAPTVSSPYAVLNNGVWGDIRPGLTPDNGLQLSAADGGPSIFVGGDMALMALAMKPYLQKNETLTWARWVAGVESVAWFCYGGFTATTPAPGYLYNVNGNWNLNRLRAIFGAYRLTGDPAWLDRYHKAMAFSINPWCNTMVQGTLITTLVPTSNGLGNYNPRGMWNSGNNYSVGDEVGVINADGLTLSPNWRGDWQSGGVYAIGDMVYDRIGSGINSANNSNDWGYYRAKVAVSGSSAAPSTDTTNWQAGYPNNYSVWIVATAVTNSSVRPDMDVSGSFLQVSAGQSGNNGGFAGLIGMAGSDTINWSDYKTTFTEWQSNIYNTVAGPPGAMRGLPGYDGDYHGNIQADCLQHIFLMMGGANGPNAQTPFTDWQQMKKLLNGHINMMLQFINKTTMVDTCTYGAPSYCCRHNLSEGFSGGILAMALALGRTDLTSAGWYLNNLITGLGAGYWQLTANFAASNYASVLSEIGVLAHADPSLAPL